VSIAPRVLFCLAATLATSRGSAYADERADEQADEQRDAHGMWIRPLHRALLQLSVADDEARPYTTPARPRNVEGVVSVTCEHREGRACGDGLGGFLELDSAAGYRDRVLAFTRLRAVAGTQSYEPALVVDRAFVRGRLGPFEAQVGRDVIGVGPPARTRIAWGDHAILAATAGSRLVRGTASWALGRLRAPQTYPGNLVSIARAQLELHGVTLGATQLLQLGGEGARELGVWGFLREHVTRADASASRTDSSNRRFGIDVAGSVAGARVYYALVFEDARDRLHDSLRYDADHLLGARTARWTLELYKTGIRSHEHVPRTTGLTHRGIVVGAPLGPDARSLYGDARLAVGRATVTPWLELARLSSDAYELVVDGRIDHVARGVDEERYRIGARIVAPLRAGLELGVEVLYEHVEDAAFVEGARRENLGASLSAVWYPEWTLP
jgi:hypothetical protein